MIAPFTKLRGVTVDSLDEVTAAFTDADWDQLDGDLTGVFHEVTDQMVRLGVDDTDQDAVLIFCRLYLKVIARDPEV